MYTVSTIEHHLNVSMTETTPLHPYQEDREEPLWTKFYHLILVFAIFGFFGNLSVMIVVWTKAMRNLVFTVYLHVLALLDCLYMSYWIWTYIMCETRFSLHR